MNSLHDIVFVFTSMHFFQFPLMVSSTGCMASTDTAKIVLECPQTRSAWEEAATNKNCSSIQNSCSSFVYHCVMNTWKNQTIEVCAPTQLILGKYIYTFSE